MLPEPRRMLALFPALTSLALGRDELAALAKQGSLHAENSSQGKRYFRLRFRMGAKQHVRYVGNHPEFVDRVRRELRQLQARAKSRRQLRRLVRQARECLRRTKHQVTPWLPLAGLFFHGREIRRQPKRGDACVDGNETLQ